ncbi:hypothetical protein [Streptomyces flavalbus]|uniref:DUF4406 domain-containing protein n=1 Tax=Streptomyces flavalbus TaxID=2665155 RepID=A0ABW2WAF2_9ACTN
MPDRPEIVCICGSTRFVDEMGAASRDLTLAGAIVVAPGVYPGGYVGESTGREIEYAQASGKPISFTDARVVPL